VEVQGVKQARGRWVAQTGSAWKSCHPRSASNVDGVGLQRPVRASTGIDGESGLPVGRRRYQAKAATSLPKPSQRKERIASRPAYHCSHGGMV